jgi:hypothetical protein
MSDHEALFLSFGLSKHLSTQKGLSFELLLAHVLDCRLCRPQFGQDRFQNLQRILVIRRD